MQISLFFEFGGERQASQQTPNTAHQQPSEVGAKFESLSQEEPKNEARTKQERGAVKTLHIWQLKSKKVKI